MKTNKLSHEEKAIEKEIDRLQPVSGDKEEKIRNILAQVKKNRSISLRVSNFDLEKLKERANREGVPYQTLITSILHKYVTNQLFDKDQVIKSFKLIEKSRY